MITEDLTRRSTEHACMITEDLTRRGTEHACMMAHLIVCVRK